MDDEFGPSGANIIPFAIHYGFVAALESGTLFQGDSSVPLFNK